MDYLSKYSKIKTNNNFVSNPNQVLTNDAIQTPKPYIKEKIIKNKTPIDSEGKYYMVNGKPTWNPNYQGSNGVVRGLTKKEVKKWDRKEKMRPVLEKIGWQTKSGDPDMLQGLVKTVGASAAIATGMAYTPASIGTFGTLGKGLLSGAVIDQGYSLLSGRPANLGEIGFGAGATMGMPLVGKSVTPLIKKGVKSTGELLNKSIQNAYKLNPYALKENPTITLYRARPIGQTPEMNMAAQFRAKQAMGEELKWWQKNLLNPQTDPDIIAREKYYGRWFDSKPSRLSHYLDKGTSNFNDVGNLEILRITLPKKQASKLNVINFEDANRLSLSPETEFVLPNNLINEAEKFPASEWKNLIKEHDKINKPHWLKGYKKIKIPNNFKSKINWGNWNKKISSNKPINGVDYLKNYYSNEDFLKRYAELNPEYDRNWLQYEIQDRLNKYIPKTYKDLYKDKINKYNVSDNLSFLNKKMTTGGISYGTPDGIYLNNSMNKFSLTPIKTNESTRVHELTHLLEKNGSYLTDADVKLLQSSFIPKKEFNAWDKIKNKIFLRDYMIDPTEIHARMNQARYKLNLKPGDVFTEEMYNKLNNPRARFFEDSFNGMGRFIQDKNKFINTMNKMWGIVPAVATGYGLPQNKKE